MPGTASVPVTLTGTCPQCGRRLALRHTKATHQPFIACSGYPSCRFTSPFEPALQTLQTRSAALQEKDSVSKTQVDKLLRSLLCTCHPDKHQGSPVAEELSKAVLALRDQLKRGAL